MCKLHISSKQEVTSMSNIGNYNIGISNIGNYNIGNIVQWLHAGLRALDAHVT